MVKATDDEDVKGDDVDENVDVGDSENVVLLVGTNEDEEVGGKELVKVEKVDVGEVVGTGHCKHVTSVYIGMHKPVVFDIVVDRKTRPARGLIGEFVPGFSLIEANLAGLNKSMACKPNPAVVKLPT